MSKVVFALIGGLLLGISLGYEAKRLREPHAGPSVPPSNQVAEIYSGSPAKPCDILVVGDSVATYGPWIANFDGTVLNEGIPGETSAELLARAPEFARHKPKILVIVSGANDVRQHVPASDTAANVSKLLALNAAPKVFVLGILPMESSLGDTGPTNKAIGQAAGTQFVPPPAGYSVADTMDGLHPNSAGYAKVLAELKPRLGKP